MFWASANNIFRYFVHRHIFFPFLFSILPYLCSSFPRFISMEFTLGSCLCFVSLYTPNQLSNRLYKFTITVAFALLLFVYFHEHWNSSYHPGWCSPLSRSSACTVFFFFFLAFSFVSLFAIISLFSLLIWSPLFPIVHLLEASNFLLSFLNFWTQRARVS